MPVLIPKVDPEVVSQFRPINLCTVPCKILTKVTVNRLKPIMSKIIGPNQTSFAANQCIIDNINIV